MGDTLSTLLGTQEEHDIMDMLGTTSFCTGVCHFLMRNMYVDASEHIPIEHPFTFGALGLSYGLSMWIATIFTAFACVRDTKAMVWPHRLLCIGLICYDITQLYSRYHK